MKTKYIKMCEKQLTSKIDSTKTIYQKNKKKPLKLTTSAFIMERKKNLEGQIKLKDSKRKEIINSELISMKQKKTKQKKSMTSKVVL